MDQPIVSQIRRVLDHPANGREDRRIVAATFAFEPRVALFDGTVGGTIEEIEDPAPVIR